MSVPSFSTIDPTKMIISPSRVTFDGLDLGGTSGNVTVTFGYKKSDVKADQIGDTILDRFNSGIDIKVTTEFLEVLDLSKVETLFPAATYISASPGALQFNSAITTRDSDNAKILILHPLFQDTASENKDWYFWKAVPTEESEFVMSPTEQSKLKIVWQILPDVSVTPYRFMRYGDKDLV